MRRSDIERANRSLLERQQQFRAAADAVTDAWTRLLTVQAVALIGSVAKPLWKFEPGSDRYLGRLCSFNRCPKGKRDCLVPGCGTTPFNKQIADFRPRDDLLAGSVMLYERRTGHRRLAADLPETGDSNATGRDRRTADAMRFMPHNAGVGMNRIAGRHRSNKDH